MHGDVHLHTTRLLFDTTLATVPATIWTTHRWPSENKVNIHISEPAELYTSDL